ncbi:MAG: endonuclease/exonuclease/phosphatase family protein [Limisphaerales bacterium]
MRVLLWNIQWAVRGSPRGERIREILSSASPDVVCLSETTLGMIPEGGYTVTSTADYGYAQNGSRRKVALWSRELWKCADVIGSPALPHGRFVSGVTLGIRFVGVCIPWRDAHVRTGRRDRRSWEDHRTYVEHLKSVLHDYLAGAEPVCLLGDFNQRIPRGTQPLEIYTPLMCLFGGGLRCVTGDSEERALSLIDHLAVDSRLTASIETIVPRVSKLGLRLSDHDGIVCRVDHPAAHQSRHNLPAPPHVHRPTRLPPPATTPAMGDRRVSRRVIDVLCQTQDRPADQPG